MVWDVQLVGEFCSPKQRVIRFLEVAELCKESNYFSQLFNLLISNQHREPVQIFEPNNGISLEQAQSILAPYCEQDCLLEGWWSVKERYLKSKASNQIERTGYRVAIKLPGTTFRYNISNSEQNLVYEIGDSNLFSLKSSKESARLNFEAVLQEIIILSSIGLNRMKGITIDSEETPSKCFLMYHREPRGFAADIGKGFETLELCLGLLQKDIAGIAEMSANVEYKIIDTGVIVFSKELIDGNLKLFYKNLEKYLESLS